MEINQKCLPSEKLQKEFEDNPLKILEIIRNEKEEEIKSIEAKKKEENSDKNSLDEKSTSFIKEKSNEESISENDSSKSLDLLKNEKIAQKEFYIKENVQDVNSSVNNINKINTINKLNYNSSFIKYDNNNITFHNLSIFFNFNNNNGDQTYYINKNTTNNYQCKNNNNISYKNNSEEANSTSSHSNDDDKNNSNNSINSNNSSNYCNLITPNSEYKLLFLFNINILLENLKTFKGSIVCQEFIDNIDNEKDCSILFNIFVPHICSIMCLE